MSASRGGIGFPRVGGSAQSSACGSKDLHAHSQDGHGHGDGHHPVFSEDHYEPADVKTDVDTKFADGIELPDEIVVQIFAWLDVPALLSIGGVCREWRRFTTEPSLWKSKWDTLLDQFEDDYDAVAKPTDGSEPDQNRIEELVRQLMSCALRGARFHVRGTRADALSALSAIIPEFYSKFGAYSQTIVRYSLQALQEQGPVALAAINVFTALANLKQTTHLEDHLTISILPALLGGLLSRNLPEEGYAVDLSDVTEPTVVCLSQLLVACKKSEVLLTALETFMKTHVVSSTWREREAALLVFGTLADAALQNNTALPRKELNERMFNHTVDSLFRDPAPVVRDTAAWTLVRLVEAGQGAFVQGPHMEVPLADAVLQRLGDCSAAVANNCCGVVMNIPRLFSKTPERLEATQRKLINIMAAACDPNATPAAAPPGPPPPYPSLADAEAAYRAMSVKALKQTLATRGAEFAGLVEKAELVALAVATTPGLPRDVRSDGDVTADGSSECTGGSLVAGIAGVVSDVDTSDSDNTAHHSADTGPSGEMRARVISKPETPPPKALKENADPGKAADALAAVWYNIGGEAEEDTAPPIPGEVVMVGARRLFALMSALPPLKPPPESSHKKAAQKDKPKPKGPHGRSEPGKRDRNHSRDYDRDFEDEHECANCGGFHERGPSDPRAYLFHALGPAMFLIRSEPDARVLMDSICDAAEGALNEPMGMDHTESAKQGAASFLVYAAAETAVINFNRRIPTLVPSILNYLPVAPFQLWERSVETMAIVAHHCPTAFRPHTDVALHAVITSADAMFEAGQHIGYGLLFMADMVVAALGSEVCQGDRLQLIFECLDRAIGPRPPPDATFCCTYHSPYFSYLLSYMGAGRTLTQVSESDPAFEPYVERLMSAAHAATTLTHDQDARVVSEAVALVAHLAAAFPDRAREFITEEIRTMVAKNWKLSGVVEVHPAALAAVGINVPTPLEFFIPFFQQAAQWVDEDD